MDRKIRVLFDANPLVRQKTGVGYYTEGVIKALAKRPEIELVGHYFRPRGATPSLPEAKGLSYTYNSWLTGQAVKALRKLGLRLPWEVLARRKADVLFFPDFTVWPSLFRKPKVLTVHDLTFVDYPSAVRRRNLRYLKKFVAKDARRSNLILTVSEFSRRRIIDVFGVSPSKVLAQPVPPPAPLEPRKSSGQPEGFILFIGTIEPRKNIQRLVEAYGLLPEELRAKHRLVIAGGTGWDSEATLRHIKEQISAGQNIRLAGYVSEDRRAALYKEALAVIVPSLYEGFGMPILEAMSYGAPVAVSDIQVFREVAGDAALYFQPETPQSIMDALMELLTGRARRVGLVKLGNAQIKRYSWAAIADELTGRLVGLTEDR